MVTNRNDNVLISGILFDGQNNTVKDILVKGYTANKVSTPADVMISNSHSQLRPITSTIINSELMDQNPLYFGNPINSESYLQVVGYDAPNGPQNNYPENFILTKIDRNNIDAKEKNIDLNFFATIESTKEFKDKTIQNSIQNFENEILSKSKEEILLQFENKVIAWERDIISNEEFLAEIQVLIEYDIIKLSNVDLDNLDAYDLEIHTWVKKLVNLWINNSITNQEFFNAIEFILQSQINNKLSSIQYN